MAGSANTGNGRNAMQTAAAALVHQGKRSEVMGVEGTWYRIGSLLDAQRAVLCTPLLKRIASSQFSYKTGYSRHLVSASSYLFDSSLEMASAYRMPLYQPGVDAYAQQQAACGRFQGQRKALGSGGAVRQHDCDPGRPRNLAQAIHGSQQADAA